MAQQTPIDTQSRLEIAAAPLKLLLLSLGSLAFVVGGYFMTLATVDTARHSAESVRFWGWVAIIFFGLCGMIGAWRALTQRGTVISLASDGLRDIRVSHDVIPWPAVASITTWEHSGQKVMVVGLHPGEEQKLRLTMIARSTRGANAALGANGLSITAGGTKISHDELMRATIAYAQAHDQPR
jgi:hypothetical protein